MYAISHAHSISFNLDLVKPKNEQNEMRRNGTAAGVSFNDKSAYW